MQSRVFITVSLALSSMTIFYVAPTVLQMLGYELIRDNFPDFIHVDISPQRNNGEWPLNSPDLNVIDYSIWSILEVEACSKPHQSIEALKKSLVEAWNAIPQDIIDKAVDDFLKCLKTCIEAGGGHFENK
uniref:Uncharacterized protein n=1 Tax=Acrobeloides nanus TaxID=290746 RepID=A0A914BZR8_9BILA